jgi:hypothetical protein
LPSDIEKRKPEQYKNKIASKFQAYELDMQCQPEIGEGIIRDPGSSC